MLYSTAGREVVAERAILVHVRERYVEYYLKHLTYLAGLVSQELMFATGAVVFDMRKLKAALARHGEDVAATFLGVRLALLDIAERTYGAEKGVVSDFVNSLAEEVYQEIFAQVSLDISRTQRLATEVAMSVLYHKPKTQRDRKVILDAFIANNLYRMDSLGRNIRSERFVRAALNVALFRVRNEVYALRYLHEPLVVYRDGHPEIAFQFNEYADVMSEFHPFSEAIVLIDKSVSSDV